MRISVVIPVYNVGKYLRRCLDSLASQTLREIEIICVDDGSTDESGEILDEYAARDTRVRVVHQENAGAGPARNTGMDLAQGEYLFFCDPDDWCDRRMLKSMYSVAARDKAEIVMVSNFYCDGDDERVSSRRKIPREVLDLRQPFAATEIADRIFQLFPHVPWNKLVRADYVRRLGLRYQSQPRTNDAFYVEAALAAASRISVLNRAFYYHRVRRPGSLMSASDRHPLTGYSARDALREFLREHGLFDTFSQSWARAVFATAMGDLASFNDVDAFERSYAEMRRRLRSDPDMALLGQEGALSLVQKQVYEAIVSNADSRKFLLVSLARRKQTIREMQKRQRKLVQWIPQGLLELMRRFA